MTEVQQLKLVCQNSDYNFFSFLSNSDFTFWSLFPPSVPSPFPSPVRNRQSEESQKEFDSLFDSVAEEKVPSPKDKGPPPLSDNDLAVFDPCYKQGEDKCDVWVHTEIQIQTTV